MFSILDRYLAREVTQTLFGVAIVLLSIFLSRLLVGYLAEAAAGEIPSDIILTLIALKSIKYLTLILPLSLFLAILLVQGRMYRDIEMVAITACGVGIMRLYRPILAITMVLLILLTALSLYALPWTEQTEDRILAEAEKNLEVTGIEAGRFREGTTGERIIYVEEISEDRSQMRNLFIQTSVRERTVLLSSERGRLELNTNTNDRYLVMLDGYRYEGTPGEADYKAIRFREHRLLIKPNAVTSAEQRRNALSSTELWGSSDPAYNAELQWRISMPLSALTLALLAMPLGKVDPRKGRYGKLFVAILIYILYVNLLAVAQSWTIKGEIPTALGLWWVHGIILLLVAIMLVKRHGLHWVMEVIRQRRPAT